jgi:hypothetical protein
VAAVTTPDPGVYPYRRWYRLSVDGLRWQSNGAPDILTTNPGAGKRGAVAKTRLRAVAPPSGSSRTDLVIGTYKPDASNTGLDTAAGHTYAGLTQVFGVNGTQTYSATNTEANRVTINDVRFRCRVNITGSAYTFKNCVFEGDPLHGLSLVQCNAAAVRNIIFQDCSFSPITVWSNTSGISGHNFKLLRCEIEHVIDGIALINANGYAPTVDNNVQIYQCYGHDFAMVSPDPGAAGGFGDNSGHVDFFQIRGGSNVHLRGNNIQMYVTTNRGIGDHFNAPLELSNNYHVTGNKYPNDPVPNAGVSIVMYSPLLGDTTNLIVEDNWIDGGSYMLNFNPSMSSSTGIVVRNNKLGPIGQRTGWGKFIICPTSQPLTVVGNVREDDGTPYNVVKAG